MMTGAGRGRPGGLSALRVGAFGWWEEPETSESCPQEGCGRGTTLVTDLYCTAHDRFLPLVRNWTNGARVTAIVISAALVYGCFALAAQSSSWLPLFFVYATIGLGIVGLPLRLFPVAVRVTVLLWCVACALSFAYHLASARAHGVMVTTLIIVAACALGSQCAIFSARDARNERTFSNADHRPRSALAFVAGMVSISLAAGLAASSLDITPRRLLIGQSTLITVTWISSAAALALALVGAVVAGMVDGAPRVSSDTAAIPAWRGPDEVTWRAQRTAIRPARIRTVIDRMGDVLRRALIRLADVLRIVAVTASRTALNLLFVAVTIVANWLIACVNFVIKVATILVRAITAGVISAAWILSRAVVLAIAMLIRTALSAGLPVAAMCIAAEITDIAAEETLRYLTSGSLAGLLLFGMSALIATVSLTVAWIILASQPASLSLLSARRSASVTGPYAVLFVAAGGWIVGLFGTLGHGRIHVGWVTVGSSTVLSAAFVWSQFSNRLQAE